MAGPSWDVCQGAAAHSLSCRRYQWTGHTQCGVTQCFTLLFLSKYRSSSPSLIPDTFLPGIHPYLQFFAVPKDLG